ncbi:MAG: branched-chain amino acid ABC transporter permease [Oceanospirillaceae bacterium]|nr:branched-chain amino acid ABC transporter permease [Oceanospirillaceae bacterium]
MRINKLYLSLLVLALLAPLVLYPVFLMKVLCYGLFACAFNLVLGYGGLLSLGHAAFLGTGAYTTGYLATRVGLTPELAILAGTAAAAALGALFGKLSVKRGGIYFGMITLALAQLVFFFYLQAPFTGGEDGMQGIPRGELFGLLSLEDNLTLYYFVLAVFLLGFWVIHRTVHSPFGQVMKAIRENEARAMSLGYNTDDFKWLLFTLSAAVAGLAGSTKALVFQLASLNDAHWQMSGEVVLMTLLGGVGTILGPLAGAGVIVTIQNQLSGGELGNYIHMIMGAIFVICVLAFRSGIVGEIQKLAGRGFSRQGR